MVTRLAEGHAKTQYSVLDREESRKSGEGEYKQALLQGQEQDFKVTVETMICHDIRNIKENKNKI
jgi:hypothetical protein